MSLIAVVSVAVALAIAVAYLAWTQRRSLRWPSDAELLEGMRREGVDLSKPHTIEFHLHFPSRQAALDAERAVVTEGYEARVSAGEGLRVAILCAKRSLVPNKSELRAISAQLVALAGQYGGTYEGWFPPHQAGGGGA
jgi:hypothetical protein